MISISAAMLLGAAILVADPPAPHMRVFAPPRGSSSPSAPPSPPSAPPEAGGKDDRVHLQLSGHALYGIGGQSFLGAHLQLLGAYAVWDAGRATGALEFGSSLQYNNEPTFLAPWLRGTGSDITGANHRVQWVATFGHGFHMGKRRRVYLGTHVYAGWNHWLSSYTVRYLGEDVGGSAKVGRSHFVAGGQLGLGYRFTRRFATNLLIGAPFPTQSSYAIGLAFVGAGVTVHLR